MCRGFGLIVTKENEYFIEPDNEGDVSHSDILSRLGWKDSDNAFNRKFIRVEYPSWKADSFAVDEQSTLPGWVDKAEVKSRCDRVLEKFAQTYAEYERVRAQAYAEYDRVRAQAYAEYKNVCDPALANMIDSLKLISGYVPE